MATENSSVSNEENAALLQKDSGEDEREQHDIVVKAKESKLTLYHWTQSFNSQKVRLAIAEKGLRCVEYDIMDYLEQNFSDEGTPRLIPEEGSTYYHRVQHYRELLDSLQMDAYTHGCILHPEITVDSHIPAYAATSIRTQILNMESELKKLAEENPELKDAYVAKQRRLKSKLFDHDNMKYLKKLLDELESVMDQVETELQRRVEETPEENSQSWLCGEFFSMADVSLAVTLHRLKFLGLSRRYWGNGSRANLEGYYERVLERPAFRRVLGHVNNILISAVLPVAFRVARKNAPAIAGTTLLIGVLGGAAYLAFLYMRRRLPLSSWGGWS
ncbi:ganglioside-induced differentiation-associated protein 1 isoform X2 [Entelurus aequoreus]|uniref:ganglioside-induced differentiation-associated protein 1 isoform X2 n=1 Tax=Entelurus aequoreus TaxID=161455 RepID=UPI002B1D52E7|nr:ganglioside-induced differentiation-associated protein 1 isoform X2 [Entelurus aequoreus]